MVQDPIYYRTPCVAYNKLLDRMSLNSIQTINYYLPTQSTNLNYIFFHITSIIYYFIMTRWNNFYPMGPNGTTEHICATTGATNYVGTRYSKAS